MFLLFSYFEKFHIITMKRIAGFICILIITLSCQEAPDLITKYSQKWELDLLTQSTSTSGQRSTFESYNLTDTKDGIIVTSTITKGESLTDGIYTKISYDGALTKDLIRLGGGFTRLTVDTESNIAMLGLSNTLFIYDRDLNFLSSRALDFGSGFQHTLSFGPSHVYNHRHVNGVQTITKFNWSGDIEWESPYKYIGCGGSTIYLTYQGMQNITLYAESYPDSLKLSQLNAGTGKKAWSKLILKNEIFTDFGYIIMNMNYQGEAILATLNSNGLLQVAYYEDKKGKIRTQTPDVAFTKGSGLVKLLPTQDGGVLLGINANSTVDSFNYKLVKLDRNGNAGWVGTFNQVGLDTIVDLIELKDGTIIVLTQKGYIQALTPQY
jgi:hypothetical protein